MLIEMGEILMSVTLLLPARLDNIDTPASFDSMAAASTELPDTPLFRLDVEETMPLVRLDGSSKVSKTLAEVLGVR